jgi:hypothetical protein
MLDFASLEVILGDYPKINFVGHGPLFWKHISADAPSSKLAYTEGPVKEGGLTCNLLNKYSNLYADLSGVSGFNAINRDHGFAKNFIEQFSGKLLFATDNGFPKAWGKSILCFQSLLEELNLSSEALRNIYWQNSIKLLLNT